MGIHYRIENTQQKRCVCGFETCASVEPRTERPEVQTRRAGRAGQAPPLQVLGERFITFGQV